MRPILGNLVESAHCDLSTKLPMCWVETTEIGNFTCLHALHTYNTGLVLYRYILIALNFLTKETLGTRTKRLVAFLFWRCISSHKNIMKSI